jgi:hypothetical protein
MARSFQPISAATRLFGERAAGYVVSPPAIGFLPEERDRTLNAKEEWHHRLLLGGMLVELVPHRAGVANFEPPLSVVRLGALSLQWMAVANVWGGRLKPEHSGI